MNYLTKILALASLVTNLTLYAAEPYDSIRSVPFTPYYVQDSYIFYDLINSHNASVIIDVESPDGGVARFVAQQSPYLPSLSKIYSVNAWTDYGAHKHLYQKFLSNVKQEYTSELITPIRMSSQEGALALNVTADFISIVGGNDAESVYKDILAWYPHLSENGIICGNNWYENAVELGVTKAANTLDQKLKIINNVWYFEKNAE